MRTDAPATGIEAPIPERKDFEILMHSPRLQGFQKARKYRTRAVNRAFSPSFCPDYAALIIIVLDGCS
jgi:uncharacterized C2H2 Zn-finger protein